MFFVALSLFALGYVVSGGLPPKPEGVTTLKSKYHDGVTISYKEPGICETTPGVKSYSGYVHLPPGLLSDINGEEQDYPINTFFWFFESRKDPIHAPLSIWLNGGPGGSSMMGLLQENGPCFVGSDSNSTITNHFSWNNEVNMLYLDQPTQVGFSYDVLTNVTVNLAPASDDRERKNASFITPSIQPADFSSGLPETNHTFLVGTVGSQSATSTANTTLQAAHALWHFAQTWFAEFPMHKPHDDRVSLWTESYGGHYGPLFWRFFEEMNERVRNGTIGDEEDMGAMEIKLDTLGIVNGLLDPVVQYPMYSEMAWNNTYGLELISKEEYENITEMWYRPGGCKDKMQKCQEQANRDDPRWRGSVPSVIECFNDADTDCITLRGVHDDLEWGWYDIAHPKEDPTPEPYMHGYLTQPHVLRALGVPVNFSATSTAVRDGFFGTADLQRSGSVEAVSYLLSQGVKVHLVYGDRDYACNWLGGEAVSLVVDYEGSEKFRSAGYAPILDATGGVGGFVRQFGNFSFSRVFQAGHEVPWYQPEISYNIFMRAMFNTDIATGLVPIWDEYKTVGPSSTFHIKNEVPEVPKPRCYVLRPETCTEEQFETVKNGTAVVKDFFVVDTAVEDSGWMNGHGVQHVLHEAL